MSAGPRNFLTPTEPGENKGGFRKVKRGEGQATVRGVSGSRASDSKMRILGWMLLTIAGGVPAFMLTGAVTGRGWCFGVMMGCLVIAHLFLIASEMITHRELPTRGRAMLICWGGFPLSWLIGGVLSMF